MKGFIVAREKSSLLLPLQGSPPELQGGGLRGLMLVGLLLEWNGSGTCKTHWLLTRGKCFPARLLSEWRGEMYPAGCRDSWRGKSRKRTTGGWALGLGSAGGAVTAVRWRSGHGIATEGAEGVCLAGRTLLDWRPGCLASFIRRRFKGI